MKKREYIKKIINKIAKGASALEFAITMEKPKMSKLLIDHNADLFSLSHFSV